MVRSLTRSFRTMLISFYMPSAVLGSSHPSPGRLWFGTDAEPDSENCGLPCRGTCIHDPLLRSSFLFPLTPEFPPRRCQTPGYIAPVRLVTSISLTGVDLIRSFQILRRFGKGYATTTKRTCTHWGACCMMFVPSGPFKVPKPSRSVLPTLRTCGDSTPRAADLCDTPSRVANDSLAKYSPDVQHLIVGLLEDQVRCHVTTLRQRLTSFVASYRLLAISAAICRRPARDRLRLDLVPQYPPVCGPSMHSALSSALTFRD